MACRSPQAQYPVYNILISGVNVNNKYGYRPNVLYDLVASSGNNLRVNSPRGRMREETTQSVFRESETQTDPFDPQIKRPLDCGLQVLTLSWLSWNNGLPAGMREVIIIERARQRRAWERALPAPFNAAVSNIQSMILEAMELNEWNYRETELAALISLRMELARKCIEENLAGNKIRYENRLFKYVKVKSEEKQVALQKVRLQLKRNLRRLNYSHNNVNRRYYRWNVLQELEDKTSELYGPQQRFGAHPMRAHEHIPEEFRYWNVFSFDDIMCHKLEQIQLCRSHSFDYTNKSKPRHHLKELCIRETRWTVHELAKLYNYVKMYRHYEKKKLNKKSCSLRQRIEHMEEKHVTPSVTGVSDEEEDAYQAAVTTQKMIKGRAIQAVMFEGRVRCQELIEEVKSTHALLRYMEGVRAETRHTVYKEQRRAEMRSNEEKRKNEILLSLEGKTVADILDFLSKELLRIQNERETHAIALMADKARHEKEALEAGRRQKEEERSREHVEMWRQTCKTYQNSLDVVAEELDLFMRNQFSAEEARKEATEYAKKIDQAAMEAHLRGDQLEEEEIIADLVYNFALPDAEKEMVRSRLKIKQKSLLSTCHDEIYSQIEMLVTGERSSFGRLVSIPRPKQRQYEKKDYVTYVELNKAGASVSSDDTFRNFAVASFTGFHGPDDEWSTGFTPKEVLIRGGKTTIPNGKRIELEQ